MIGQIINVLTAGETERCLDMDYEDSFYVSVVCTGPIDELYGSPLRSRLNRLCRAGYRRFHFDATDSRLERHCFTRRATPFVRSVMEDASSFLEAWDAKTELHILTEDSYRAVRGAKRSGVAEVTLPRNGHSNNEIMQGLKIAASNGDAIRAGLSVHVDYPDPRSLVSFAVDYLYDHLLVRLVPDIVDRPLSDDELKKGLRFISGVREGYSLHGYDISIMAMGGVSPENVRRLRGAGADRFVVGRCVLGEGRYRQGLERLREALG